MPWWSWPLGTVEFLVAWLVFDGPLRGKLWHWLDEFNSYQPVGPVFLQPHFAPQTAEEAQTLLVNRGLSTPNEAIHAGHHPHPPETECFQGCPPAQLFPYTGKSICWNCNKPHDGPVGRCPECAEKYGKRAILGQPSAFGPMATQLRDQLRRYPEDREKLIARFGADWVPPRPTPDFGGVSNCLGLTATETMWLQD
jgi:hypothetical protein